MNKIIATLVFSAATLGMHSAAMAADPVKAQYKAAVASADADYKEAKAKCDPLKGNEKDVCMKEAKGAQKTAIANAKALARLPMPTRMHVPKRTMPITR